MCFLSFVLFQELLEQNGALVCRRPQVCVYVFKYGYLRLCECVYVCMYLYSLLAAMCAYRYFVSIQEAAAPISKKGFLYKTGSDRAGWKRRYCTLDRFRGFQY